VTETATCPCCGQPMAVERPTNLASLPMSIMQQTILRRLIKAYPASVDTDAMQDHVYSGVGDPPLSAGTIMAIQMNRLRKILNRHGWTVPTERGGRGNHARYRLMKLEAGDAPSRSS